MSAADVAPAASQAHVAIRPEGRIVTVARRRGMGIFVLILAVVMFWGFGLGVPTSQQATFLLTAPPAVAVSPLVMSVHWVSMVLGILAAALALVLMIRRSSRGAYLIFTLGVILFFWAFLMWVSRDETLNFVDMLAETLIATTPLIYGSMSGLLCERAGVVNIAIEGQFLAGAFLGAMIGSVSGDLWLGMLGGAVAGGIFGSLLAFLALRYGADQIIVGVVIVAFCTGLTNFLTEQVLTPNQTTLNSPNTFSPIALPLLSKIPILGPVLFDQNIFVYLAVVLLVAINIGLFNTRRGLRVRAVGEHPRAAETVGISVMRIRYQNVIMGGVIAGIGGAVFTLGSVGQFSAGMTDGYGYVALAAMIFGRWRPFGALVAALLFGFAISVQSFVAIVRPEIPSPFLSMAPYIITIAVVSGLVGRVRAPAADGKPYTAEG
ncbi:MAG: ABC transporter permease [Acidimicrobiales bacterium]